jgi:phospholipase D1/2
VEDLRAHFVQKWNFIYNDEYSVINERHYETLTMGPTSGITYNADGSDIHVGSLTKRFTGSHAHAHTSGAIPEVPSAPQKGDQSHHHFHPEPGSFLDSVEGHIYHGAKNLVAQHRDVEVSAGKIAVQLVRSSARWSHGIPTEVSHNAIPSLAGVFSKPTANIWQHSIANAYIEVIQNSQHFIYIENQFFITATSDEQHPVKNKIGAAIVDRILRAAKAGEKYKVIVAMPSVPGFAGDIHEKSSVGTLAIMNFQYRSICRGGYSIMEMIEKAGVDPKKYIQFYNLRNYDRINISAAMSMTEQASGVQYETARKEHDDLVGAGYLGRGGEETEVAYGGPSTQYDRYQQAASTVKSSQGSQYDTVSSSYMLDGPPLTSIPWSGSPDSELDSYVSEELYIHTKCLIADDRVVIVGSANLNDRSQLGDHDSEIAVVIEDPTPVISQMNEQPFEASQFAASLRRQIFRKHLGLLPPQDCTKPDANFTPPNKDPNTYDWGSAPDLAVQDPLSPAFEELWTARARLNTEIFERVFRPVPTNKVRTWEQYEEYYAQYFVGVKDHEGKITKQPQYEYGHVFKEAFPGGVGEVKELLGQVRGTLVEMPLDFLCEVEGLVKEGLDYNAITAEIYT